ncbi:hypothetical protein ED388_04550 [Muribaculaceae bacterium Isolate-007 (NCI)]|nr:hypothetical protein EEL42_03270 [Muribaculaceae bacterium Isolate-100 (HZI)]RXE66257.1 hypothetical protein ED388_04550 [Muribaculaceae bacterium Isolate-007 (NCI)]
MIPFKQSPVIFDEGAHRYRLGEKRLLGITGLIHSILGLGVYPEADPYVKDFLIPKAGSRGTAIHHAIQTYDQLGVRQTIQTVNTRQGDHYEVMEWDVSRELDNYIRHLNGFIPLANELTVSDNDKYASQIDNVWQRVSTNGIWLVDTKSNNLDRYPLCGYFNPAYFNNREDALKEYLSWQLSVYAELFEAENPGIKVEGLACNWLRQDRAAFWVIQRKPSELVRELLSTEYIFIDGNPVYLHHDPSVFGITPNLPATNNEILPVVPQNVISYIAGLLALEKDTKAKLEDAKTALRMAMEQHGIKSWDSGQFKATIAADSTRATFDSARLKKDHPDLYEQYIINKPTKGGFTLK